MIADREVVKVVSGDSKQQAAGGRQFICAVTSNTTKPKFLIFDKIRD
jgi:hypothetical protein